MRSKGLETLRLHLKSEGYRCRLLRRATKRSKYRRMFSKKLDTQEKELRCLHLAYGFLLGIPYLKMEGNRDTLPNWGRVREICVQYLDENNRSFNKFGIYWKPEKEEEFQNWLNAQ